MEKMAQYACAIGIGRFPTVGKRAENPGNFMSR
jgi:hypothetical protein